MQASQSNINNCAAHLILLQGWRCCAHGGTILLSQVNYKQQLFEFLIKKIMLNYCVSESVHSEL